MFGKTSPLTIPAKAVGKRAKIEGDEEKKTRKKRKKKWTKPEGKPKRPLSAYNIFFARERILMLGKDVPTAEQEAQKKKVHCKTHGKISFAVMARTIGAKWKALGPNEKKFFEDRARTEKARYLRELSSWKEAQKSGGSVCGESDVRKVVQAVQDATATAAVKKSPIESGSGITQAGLEMSAVSVPDRLVVDMNTECSVAKRSSQLADSNGTLSAVERIPRPLSQEINCNDSNLMRLILEEESRRRYLSLLNLQSNSLPDFSQANQHCHHHHHHQYPQLDQSLFHRNGMNQRVSTPVDSFSGFRSPYPFDLDTSLAERSLLRNLQGSDNPSFREYNSRYLRVLEEYSAILQLEEQHKRMMGN